MATTNGITANVVDGKLDYSYTDSSKKDAPGANLGYDQFLQLLCAEMQYQDPLEPTSNTDYVAQLATFSQLEATLTMADTEQSTMASGLVGKQVILKVTNDTTGATNYVDGKVDYVLYQNGDIMLSVNNGLYSISTLDTVADSDYYEAVGMGKGFGNMVSQFPSIDNLNAGYKTLVEQVREIYNSMTDYQKSFVDKKDYEKFVEIESRVKQLVAIAEAAANSSSTSGTDAETDTETDTETVEE